MLWCCCVRSINFHRRGGKGNQCRGHKLCGSLKESIVNAKIMEMTENEIIHYQSHMNGHVESVTIEEARECVGKTKNNRIPH